MKSCLACVLAVLVLLQTFSREVLVVDYALNRATITARFCVNKARPMLHCNGRCYFAKQLKQQQFWKKTTSTAALFATLGGFAFSVALKFLPRYVDLSGLAGIGFAAVSPEPADGGAYVIPFMDRMAIVFFICVAVMVIISLYETSRGVVAKGLEIDRGMFKTSRGFAIGSLVVVALVTTLYTVYW